MNWGSVWRIGLCLTLKATCQKLIVLNKVAVKKLIMLSKVSVNEEIGCSTWEKEDLVNILQETSPLPFLMHPKQTTLMNRRWLIELHLTTCWLDFCRFGKQEEHVQTYFAWRRINVTGRNDWKDYFAISFHAVVCKDLLCDFCTDGTGLSLWRRQ